MSKVCMYTKPHNLSRLNIANTFSSKPVHKQNQNIETWKWKLTEMFSLSSLQHNIVLLDTRFLLNQTLNRFGKNMSMGNLTFSFLRNKKIICGD